MYWAPPYPPSWGSKVLWNGGHALKSAVFEDPNWMNGRLSENCVEFR